MKMKRIRHELPRLERPSIKVRKQERWHKGSTASSWLLRVGYRLNGRLLNKAIEPTFRNN
jgi:hypothetical protein